MGLLFLVHALLMTGSSTLKDSSSYTAKDSNGKSRRVM